MDNFEVHPRGTSEELQLCRALIKEVGVYLHHNEVLPDKITLAYNRLIGYYTKQMEVEK